MKKNQITRVIWQNPSTSDIPSDLSKLSLSELDNVTGGKYKLDPSDKLGTPPVFSPS